MSAPAQTPGGAAPEPVGPPPPAQGWRRLVPWWVRVYRRDLVRGDVIAGLTVAVLLVPQAMAYATLAELPPVTGLYAATLPLLVYALLGTSGQLAVGPVAIVALLTASAVAPRADTPGEAVAIAGLLALLVGGLQIILGLLRLGKLASVLRHPVIVGFTSAAAIVIALSQLRELFGVSAPRSSEAIAAITGVVTRLDDTHLLTFVVGTSAIAVLVLARRLAPRLPAPLLLLVAGIGVSIAFGLGEQGVNLVGDVPAGLPVPTLPDLDAGLVVGLLPSAAAIALIGYAEGLSVARAIARTTGDRIDADRELVATGAANAAAATVQAMPVAGGFSRSAVNHQAGARTPLSSVITAGVVAVVALVFTPLLAALPNAILAAVIVVAVLSLVDIGEVVRLLRAHPADGAVAVVTFAATFLLGIEPGLAIGVAAGLAAHLLERRTRRTAGWSA